MDQKGVSARQDVSEDSSQDRCVRAQEAVQADTSECADKNNSGKFFFLKKNVQPKNE